MNERPSKAPSLQPGIRGLLHLQSDAIPGANLSMCQDGLMVGFFRIDPMVSGSSPTSAKLSLRVRRVASSL